MVRSITDEVIFGSNRLQSVNGLTVTAIDNNRMAKRAVANNSLAYTDNSVTTSAFYHEKIINVQCVIALSGRELLDASLGELRRIIQPINQTLIIPVETAWREYHRVTMQNYSLSNVAGGYAEVNIEFIAGDPFSYDRTPTTLLSVSGLTSGNKSYPVTVHGTADALPYSIAYTLNSATLTTNRTITIEDPSTGYGITVQRNWTAADALVINCQDKTVTVNGDDVEFTGNFMNLGVGDGHVNYTDDFTARNVNIVIGYYKRYL